MLIGINSQHQIKQIRNVTDESLTAIELDENDLMYPFTGWNDMKILSYCYEVKDDGFAVYPYINTNILEKLELQEQENLTLALAIAEVYELLAGGGQ